MGRGRGMVLFAALLAGAAAIACRRPAKEPEIAFEQPSRPDAAPAPAPADVGGPRGPDWEATSRLGTFTVRQQRTGPESCRVECVPTANQGMWRWSAGTCLAGPDELVFLDEDGDRVLVLEPRPAFEEGALLRAELATAYLRGAPQQKVKAAQVLEDPDKLPREGGRYRWLAGVRGESGGAPRLVEAGVQVRTLDDLVRTLRFDGTVQLEEAPTVGLEGADAGLDAGPGDAGDAGDSEDAGDAGDPAEASWRARFRAARTALAAAEGELEAARAQARSIEKDGLADHAPQPVFYADSMTREQRDQAQTIAFLQYKKVIADHLDAAKKRALEAEQKLRAAQEGLEDLERKAGYEAVPFEWRR